MPWIPLAPGGMPQSCPITSGPSRGRPCGCGSPTDGGKANCNNYGFDSLPSGIDTSVLPRSTATMDICYSIADPSEPDSSP